MDALKLKKQNKFSLQSRFFASSPLRRSESKEALKMQRSEAKGEKQREKKEDLKNKQK